MGLVFSGISLLAFGVPHVTDVAIAGAGDTGIPLLSEGLVDEGVGLYTDPSVAFQVSTFTINRRMVSCGVGTMAGPAPGSSGPFAMVMWATKIDSYDVDRDTPSIIRAKGVMRSITRMGTQTVEDVQHPFVAVATDNHFSGPDRFEVHFVTPFWNPANAMATKSDMHSGWVRFGGNIMHDGTGAPGGDVSVVPAQP
jgi:hypothetical protein